MRIKALGRVLKACQPGEVPPDLLLHLRQLTDRQLPKDSGRGYELSRILRAEFLVDAQTMSKMQGVPFRVGEIEAAITALLGGKS